MALEVHLEAFEGPLDLLLFLIEKNKVDIYDIPIFEITQQYVAYLRQMEEMNMEIASEFIVMAATLINIKARMLLPVEKTGDEEEEDPREALVRRLIEYQKYKNAARKLKERLPDPERLILMRRAETIRGERPIPKVDVLLKDVEVEQLFALYQRAVLIKEESYDTVRGGFRSVEREEYTVEEKIDSLFNMLTLLKRVSFVDLRKESHSRLETITMFQAMLELGRMNLVTLSQDGLFGDIIMKPRQEETTNGST